MHKMFVFWHCVYYSIIIISFVVAVLTPSVIFILLSVLIWQSTFGRIQFDFSQIEIKFSNYILELYSSYVCSSHSVIVKKNEIKFFWIKRLMHVMNEFLVGERPLCLSANHCNFFLLLVLRSVVLCQIFIK